jgi:hypothetical protein
MREFIPKEETRILAWDDGSFDRGQKGKIPLVGVVFRGGSFMDGLIKREVEIDGTDAEQVIIEAIRATKFKDLRVMMTDGITFGGFNTVNIRNIYQQTGLPVIAVNRKAPDFPAFMRALDKFPDSAVRKKAVSDSGDIQWVDVKAEGMEGNLAVQTSGIGIEHARRILRLTCMHALMPEPLRIAHLIATGLVKGESVGRA